MTDYTHDDDFDDEYGDDPFADLRAAASARPHDAASAEAPVVEPAADDPFELEPVLDGDDYQATPNSYNVRNIVLIAAGGFVLVMVAFLFSMSGGEEEDLLAVGEGANGTPVGATVPDASMRPQLAPEYPEDDLSLLLDDPTIATGGSGAYQAAAPRSARPAAVATGDRPPSYRELRKESFLAAIGRPTRRAVDAMPAGPSGPVYMVDAAGNVIGPAPGSDPNAIYTDASANAGLVQPASTWGSGGGGPRGAAPGGTAAMRAASTQAQPEFSTFTLPKGTLINVTLETGVNSDRAGVFIARTTEDVYDRTRRHIVIPRGSQIVSSYQSGDVMGDRLTSEVDRLNLPDGRSVDFSAAQLYDAQGKAGLRDIVHRHTGSKVGAGLLQAATGIGAAVAGRRVRSERVLIRNPDGTTSEVPLEDDLSAEAAHRGTRGAERTVQSATERTLSRPNTVILRSGLRALVVVEDDIDMGRPYYNSGVVPTGRSPFDVRPAPGTVRARSGPPQLPRGPQVPAPPPVRSTVRTVGAQR